MKKVLIIAGGDKPEKRLVSKLTSSGYNKIICADGGFHNALKAGLVPDYIIGDFDSVGDLSLVPDKCKLIKYRRQSDTDVEKCVKFALAKGTKELLILGGIGDRLDHSIANIGLLAKYSDRAQLYLFYGNTYCFAASGEVAYTARKGETVSVYGLTKNTRVTSGGLKFKMINENIFLGGKESTSNIASSTQIMLNIKNGKALIVREKNSFFL